jgi:hypothetical protein
MSTGLSRKLPLYGKHPDESSPYDNVIVSRVTEDGGKVNCTTLPETDAVALFVVTASGCSKVLCSCTSPPPSTSVSAEAALASPRSIIRVGRASVRWGLTTVSVNTFPLTDADPLSPHKRASGPPTTASSPVELSYFRMALRGKEISGTEN